MNNLNEFNSNNKNMAVNQNVSDVNELNKLREKNKVINFVKDVLSLGIRHVYWNHQLKVSLLNNHSEGVKQALAKGASQNLSLKNWKLLTQNEGSINQESVKLFIQFSILKNKNRLVEKKWVSQLFREKMTPQNMNTISKIISVYSSEYSNIYDNKTHELDKFSRVFLKFISQKNFSNKTQDIQNIQETIMNIIEVKQKLKNSDSHFILSQLTYNDVDFLKTSINLLNSTNCSLLFISKMENFFNDITFDNIILGDKNFDKLFFSFNESLIQAKKNLFLQSIKEKNIYLINALILANVAYQGVIVNPIPEKELLNLLEKTLDYPRGFWATINRFNELDHSTIKIIFNSTKNFKYEDKKLLLKKLLEKLPENYHFNEQEQQYILQLITSSNFDSKTNELISQIDFNQFNQSNKNNPLLQLTSKKDPFSQLMIKKLIESGLSTRGATLALYAAHIHQNNEMINMINQPNLNKVNLQPDDILVILSPTLDLDSIDNSDIEVMNDIKIHFINFFEEKINNIITENEVDLNEKINNIITENEVDSNEKINNLITKNEVDLNEKINNIITENEVDSNENINKLNDKITYLKNISSSEFFKEINSTEKLIKFLKINEL
ncbi:MAG: hypothetical protein Q8K60_05185 [Parachlamydiaceae bacterium]|nr:hypothetical protein [Parachlamydiaceae bacterium]